jgi:4-amino-4-deoxy-L-arabinose transferase-like glycosyltransferase
MSAGYAAWRQDWTYDERIHVAWSERFLDTGEVERQSQPRFDSKTTIQVPNVLAGRVAHRLGVRDQDALRFAVRIPALAWLLLLLVAVHGTVHVTLGGMAAHLATLALALDPNLIAHGSLATSDVPFVLAAWLTLAAALAVAARPGLATGVVLGLALGLAFATKFTAVLLVPAVALIPVAWSGRPSWRALGRLGVSLGAAAVAAYLVIAAAYSFRGIGEPLAAIPFRSGVMTRLAASFPGLRSPLPTGFVTGLDFALRFESPSRAQGQRPRTTSNRIRVFPHGGWFYFGWLWLLKTPVAVVVSIAVGWWTAARAGLLLHRPEVRYLAVNVGVWLFYLSFILTLRIGYRLSMLCIPPAVAIASAGLALLPGRAAGRVGLAFVVAALVELAGYAGNPLSFTNAAVWPKRLVYRVISDSNVDWGQNRHRIKGWLARSGVADSHLDPLHVLPGHNTFSLNVLAGVFDFERHRWLRENASPEGHYGHTYLWFRIDDALYTRFLVEQRRLLPHPQAETRCDGARMTHQPPGTRLDFELDGPLAPHETWNVCVSTARGAQFGLRAVEGHAAFGPLRVSGAPTLENVEEGQVAWYLLEPGTHAFVLNRIPNRRSWLPNVFAGRWLVRERAVSLAVAPGHATPAQASGGHHLSRKNPAVLATWETQISPVSATARAPRWWSNGIARRSQ